MIEINASETTVLYLESICRQAEAEGKYIRQTGGSGNYGHCKLRIEPNEPGKGYEFIDEIKGGVVPGQYIKPIDEGVQAALELGILAGYPIVDVKVILYDGGYHEGTRTKWPSRLPVQSRRRKPHGRPHRCCWNR